MTSEEVEDFSLDLNVSESIIIFSELCSGDWHLICQFLSTLVVVVVILCI